MLTHAECALPDVQPSAQHDAQPALQRDGIHPGEMSPFCFSGWWGRRVWHPPSSLYPSAAVGRGGWQRATPRCCKVAGHVLLRSITRCRASHRGFLHSIFRPHELLAPSLMLGGRGSLAMGSQAAHKKPLSPHLLFTKDTYPQFVHTSARRFHCAHPCRTRPTLPRASPLSSIGEGSFRGVGAAFSQPSTHPPLALVSLHLSARFAM
jgi:hypothetical protein